MNMTDETTVEGTEEVTATAAEANDATEEATEEVAADDTAEATEEVSA